MRKLKREFFFKRQNRPSGIRFTGVLPPSTMYKNSKIIERNLFSWAINKTRNLSTNVKIDPQEYVYQGSPPSTMYKNPKNIERTLFRWAKIKTRYFSENVKRHPHKYVYQGSPLPLLSTKTPKT